MPDESLMVAWRAAEAAAGGPEEASEVPSEATETTEPDAPALAAEPKAAAKEEAKAAVKEVALATGEIEQLKALSEKLGYKIEDGRVTVAERAKLREEKREARAKITALEADLGQKVTQARESLKGFVTAKDAWERGDIDGFAKALGGYADWNELQKDVINRFADPSYKEIQELKRKQKDRDDRDTQQAEQSRQVAVNRERTEAIAAYKRGLSQEMAGSSDPLVKAMHEDSFFVDAIHAIQDKNYDRATDSTLTPEEALEHMAPGQQSAFRAELSALYARLRPAFEPAGTVSAQPGKKSGKTSVTKREAEPPHISKPGGSGFMDPKDREYWANQLKSSED